MLGHGAEQSLGIHLEGHGDDISEAYKSFLSVLSYEFHHPSIQKSGGFALRSIMFLPSLEHIETYVALLSIIRIPNPSIHKGGVALHSTIFVLCI
jgi:hypothetical protein